MLEGKLLAEKSILLLPLLDSAKLFRCELTPGASSSGPIHQPHGFRGETRGTRRRFGPSCENKDFAPGIRGINNADGLPVPSDT